MIKGFWHGLVFCLLLSGWLTPACAESCRIAYDLGSSGIRVGASNRVATAQADIDFLSPLWAGRGLDEVIAPAAAALMDLPRQADLPQDCVRVAAGFSAWRLALKQDRPRLLRQLRELWQQTGTAIIVAPQSVEGRYGYQGARLLLGDRLKTSHVLDIGGGSLQLAGVDASFGLPLGQKSWHRHLCQQLRPGASLPCVLQPMLPAELAHARALATKQFAPVPATLGRSVSVTAISRPVTRGVAPAVEKLLGESQAGGLLDRERLTRALTVLAVSTPAESAARLAVPQKYLAYLLSDAILLEGILRAAEVDQLIVLESDQSNIPGLLGDEQAFAWAGAYACYLDHLARDGIVAYMRPVARCRERNAGKPAAR